MGRKDKKPQVKPKNDTFDVKSNLKKLGSSLDRNSYMYNGKTEDDYYSDQFEAQTISSHQDEEFKTTFEIYSLKQDRKLTSELSSFKDAVHGKINQDVKDAKKEIDNKLNGFEVKLENIVNKYVFGGVIAFALILVGVIYVLSYQPLIEKTNKISDENIVIKDTLKSIQFNIKNKKR